MRHGLHANLKVVTQIAGSPQGKLLTFKIHLLNDSIHQCPPFTLRSYRFGSNIYHGIPELIAPELALAGINAGWCI